MSRSFSVGGAAVVHILSWFTLVRRACCAGGSGSFCQDFLRFDASAARVRKGVRITLGLTRAVSVRELVWGLPFVGRESRSRPWRSAGLCGRLEGFEDGRHCGDFGRTIRRAGRASLESFGEMLNVQGIFSVAMAHVCAQWALSVCRGFLGFGSR